MSKVTLTGNPVRSAIRHLSAIPYPELSHDGHIRILVTGGSQGASIFSQIVPTAIAALPAALRSRIRIDQQCREADLETTRAAYAQMNVSADLSAFFTDIPARLASAHLVIARAGASTIAELTAAGRPSILVPLPTALDNHQYYNANALEEAGGGWVMPQDGFTAAALSARIEAFLSLPESLTRTAQMRMQGVRAGFMRRAIWPSWRCALPAAENPCVCRTPSRWSMPHERHASESRPKAFSDRAEHAAGCRHAAFRRHRRHRHERHRRNPS